MITRRQFVQGTGAAGLGLLAGCGRLPGQAQAPPRIPRIGVLATSVPGTPNGEAFLRGLREHGYVEGQSIVIEWRSAAVPDELSALAAELVRLPVDVIVAPATTGVLAAKQETSAIPIVFVTLGDPVGLGLVESLARPGGNVTGVSTLSGPLSQKRLELLKQVAPQVSRVVCLYHAADPSSTATMQLIREAARPQAVTVEALGVQAPEEFDGVFEAATQLSADALITSVGPFLSTHRQRIVDFAARARLPAMYAWPEAVNEGGLLYYGADTPAQFRRAANYVDRLLKGAKPADLPVEQAMTFEFVINLRTSRALGLTIPQHVLLQATEVIE